MSWLASSLILNWDRHSVSIILKREHLTAMKDTYTFAAFMICLETVLCLADFFTEKILLQGKVTETWSCNSKNTTKEKLFVSWMKEWMQSWVKVFFTQL